MREFQDRAGARPSAAARAANRNCQSQPGTVLWMRLRGKLNQEI
jgi:hypothetical protein